MGEGGCVTIRARLWSIVTPDGERFLLTKLPAEQSRPRIVVVLNWFDELTAKVPR
jgi:hypothetical protein